MAIDKWVVWLTWREAVAMVAAAYGCDETAAAHKIKRAWQDGQVRTNRSPTRQIYFFRKHIERIRPRTAPSVIEPPSTPTGKVAPKKRGPQPEKRGRVMMAMRDSEHTVAILSTWSRLALAKEFKTSESTAQRALQELQAEKQRSDLSKLT